MENFVTSKIAKKLQEKGYPMVEIPIGGRDNRNGPVLYDLPKDHTNWQNCKAWWIPTISQVLKWLREAKKIYLELVIIAEGVYMCDIYKITVEPVKRLGSTEYSKTYEAAAIAGIEYVLDKLI